MRQWSISLLLWHANSAKPGDAGSSSSRSGLYDENRSPLSSISNLDEAHASSDGDRAPAPTRSTDMEESASEAGIQQTLQRGSATSVVPDEEDECDSVLSAQQLALSVASDTDGHTRAADGVHPSTFLYAPCDCLTVYARTAFRTITANKWAKVLDRKWDMTDDVLEVLLQ